MTTALDEKISLANADPSPRFVERIPIRFARRFGIMGFDERDDRIKVAAPAIDRLGVLDNVGVRLGRTVEPVIADEREIQSLINRAYGAQDAGVDTILDEISTSEAESLTAVLTGDGDLLDSAGRAPVVKLVNLLLFEAVKRRASDVHVQPDADRVQVRLRIDGVLYDHASLPRHLLDEMVSRVKVIGRLNIAEKRLAQDGRTTVSVGERVIDLRISTLPTAHGERVVLRLLDKSARLYTLSELGMHARDLEIFRWLIRRTHGIVLVTGPTGSGKSTTLYAALQELNSAELNILTLEDPIEYQLDGVSQTQVSTKKGMTFATGLRTVLRQDPDVIMVGEIRDEETARMAVQSALTGHLVFSTLHTNDAAGAVARLIDLGVEPYLVAGSVAGVMAQRLVRCICDQCKEVYRLGDDDRAGLGIAPEEGPVEAARGRGCDRCLQTGYYGRSGIFELFATSDSIRRLILARADSRQLMRAAKATAMRTLREDALQKMREHVTTAEEVLRVTHECEEE